MANATTASYRTLRPTPESGRVLIASDSVGEAEQLVGLLRPHVHELRTSVLTDRAVAEFESFAPDVIVLAFDTLEKAKNYYLSLHRESSILPGHPHRTVVLCTKDEVREAFDLCVKRYFDDYVLYWPLVQDGLRLPMSICIACREIKASPEGFPQRAEWLAHAKQLGTLESTLARELSIGAGQIGIARDSLVDLEKNLSRSSDEFSGRMVRGGPETGIEVRDPQLLAQEIDRLKRQQIEQVRNIRVDQVEPIRAWAQNLKQEVEPVLASARAITETARSIRPIIMVVDDDDLSQDLVARALATHPYQLLFANDGAAALRELERVRPDAIFMDFRLPGIDGVALTRRLKASKRFASIPIIMMTGDSRADTLLGSIQAGAASFVVKPFTSEALLGKLQQALAS